MKQLTIAIPAYNAEIYIRKCLDSMVGIDERLEIIVINDGSKDSTEHIAKEYVKKYPDQVQLISKENGGHGSGINAAISIASGRYFKVIDADDWIVTENLTPLLDRLEKSCADAVITGYQTINMLSGKVISYPCKCSFFNKEISLSQLLEVYSDISACCSFHGLFYRTEMYRNANIKLSEGIFYEDQEYATLPFAYVDSILVLPVFFYQYLIGNSNQSVAFHNQVKRIDHIEKVVRQLLTFREKNGPLSADREEYFLKKISIVIVTYYATALVKNKAREEGKGDAERFHAWLEQVEPLAVSRTEKKYKLLCILHKLRFPAKYYEVLLDTSFYSTFRKLWMK